MLAFTQKEKNFLFKLDTPLKIQDYLNTLKFNFEKDGVDTLKSPIYVLRTKSAHCIEGAIFAAYALSLQGFPPLILHLKTTKEDFDHVVAVFKKDGYWGAISKTNHAVLRYREPIYKNIRELVMSYFHEYFLENGKKTLRSYSKPLNLNIFEKGWEVKGGSLWGIDEELDKIKHYKILSPKQIKDLRRADKIEIKAGEIVETKAPSKAKIFLPA